MGGRQLVPSCVNNAETSGKPSVAVADPDLDLAGDGGGAGARWGAQAARVSVLHLRCTSGHRCEAAGCHLHQACSLFLSSWDERICPALGITWANQLLVRLMVDRRWDEEPTLGPASRTLRVLFAPHLPSSSCSYMVNEEGVRGMPGTESY